ncbi:MAG: hypothetical protein ACXV2C_00700 [Candidatus Bathyarchaeia archaeon]
MSANTSLSITSLDFDTLKQQYIKFLSTQSVLKDYSFTDSNMNVLIDLQTYNTYLNAFYLNMVASEMFLDSAQKLDSVVSHAKELNYLPQSARSSEASVSFTVQTIGLTPPFAIPKGALFTGVNTNGQFTFTTDQETNYFSGNSTYLVANLQIFEGPYLTDTYVIDYTQDTQQFILTNPNIDLDSLVVTVTASAVNTTFNFATTLFGLNGFSNVYFLQAAQNGQYELIFGDNLFGRYPDNLSLVTANYRVAVGNTADGINSFTLTQGLSAFNGGASISISGITVAANSSGGASPETIESIRFSAPRYFATQQRALASDDYSALILDNFGGVIKDVNTFGGQLLPEKKYGRVVAVIQPQSGTIAPDYVKSEISNFLLSYMGLPTRLIIQDPNYLYCAVTTTIQYDPTKTSLLPNDITSLVLSAIETYSSTNLQKFNGDLRFSKFVATIDNAASSIVSNETSLLIISRLTPYLGFAASYTLNFNNAANVEIPASGTLEGIAFDNNPVITSSPFTYVDSKNVSWPISYIRDDNLGNLVVYTMINNIFTVLNPSLGTINYATGVATINNLITTSYGNYISIYMEPMNPDIIVDQSEILIIDPNDVAITVVNQIV